MKIRNITSSRLPKHYKPRWNISTEPIGISVNEIGEGWTHSATTVWIGRRYVNIYTTRKN